VNAQNTLEFHISDTYRILEMRAVSVRECDMKAVLRACDKPELCLQFFRDVVEKADWYDHEKEVVVVLLMDRKSRLKAWNLVSIGSLTSSVLHPREILRPALAAAASAVVIMHNHPSGDPAPSSADVIVTRNVRKACNVMDVLLLDHVIVGRAESDPAGKGYYSFRLAGLI